MALVPGDLADEASVGRGVLAARAAGGASLGPQGPGLRQRLRQRLMGAAIASEACRAPSWPRRGEAGVLRRLAPALLWLQTAVQALDPLADSQARELSSQRRAATGLPLLRHEGDNKAHEEARGAE